MRDGRAVLAWTLAAAGLLAAAWAVAWRGAPDTHRNPPPRPTVAPSFSPTATIGRGTAPGHGNHTPAVVILILVAAIVVLLAWALSRIQWQPRRRRRAAPAPEAIDYAAVAEELARTAAERRRLLAGADPRTGVLRAWLDVQAAAERSGLPRGEAETSSEFTARVLSVWAVDPAALGALAAAYREAQFSDHPIGEEIRQGVVVALDRIEQAIAAQVPAGAAP